jgi:hypothetical protein
MGLFSKYVERSLKPKLAIVPIEIGDGCKSQNDYQDCKDIVYRQVSKDAQLNEDNCANKSSNTAKSNQLEVWNEGAQGNGNKDNVQIRHKLVSSDENGISKFGVGELANNSNQQNRSQDRKVQLCFAQNGFQLIIHLVILYRYAEFT